MKKIFTLFVLLVSFGMMQAQVTTASMSGRVTDGRESLPGVNIRVTHVPTGTISGTATNVDGRFFIQGMRPGGPYRVEITFLGFADYVREDIYLQLGQTFVLDANLREGALALEGVEIVAERGSRFTTERTGPSTNVTSREIGMLPVMNRSIQDLLRLSPYAGSGMSIGGSDGRSTNFTLDGANMNDNFGLSGGMLPGGGNPVSLDAIEEVQITIAPFDVRQTNFIGGGVNAVTRSGTNQFRGTAYIFHRNENMHGSRIGDIEFRNTDGFDPGSTTIYGASVGGAIIPNRLFFFGNFEYEDSPGNLFPIHGASRPANFIGEGGRGTGISRAYVGHLQQVSDHLRREYGYETGGFMPSDFPGGHQAMRALFRLDWNITDRHRLTARYNFSSRDSWIRMNDGSIFAPNQTVAGGPTAYRGRTSEYSWSFANSTYSQAPRFHTGAIELNSRFTDRMSNQFIATFSSNNNNRGSLSDPFPTIEILDGHLHPGGVPPSPAQMRYYIAGGYEPFSWHNGVDQRTFSIINNFTYVTGRHRIMAGVSYEQTFADNSFLPHGRGTWRFASMEDFFNRAAPVGISISTPTNGATRPNIASEVGQFGIYAQTEWQATNNLQLTLGIRADNVLHLHEVMTNQAIYEIEFGYNVSGNPESGVRRINTGQWPANSWTVSPRAGFVWDVNNDRSLIVRGGTGLFMGRMPMLFLANMAGGSGLTRIDRGFARTGFTTNAAQGVIGDSVLGQLAGVRLDTPFEEILALLGINPNVTPETGSVGPTVGIDPNFKMPQVWKTSLGFDYEIPTRFPFSATVEGTFTRLINDIMMEDWGMRTRESDTWARFEGPDDRIIYPADRRYPGAPTSAVVLVNTNQGYGFTFNVTLRAEPIRNFNLMLAYTRTEMREISDMPGNQALQTWQNITSVNGPNLAEASRSAFVIPSQLVGFASWTTPTYLNRGFFNTSTTFGLFYRGRSLTNASFVFTNDFTGVGLNRDLIWIPETRDCLRFVSDADRDAFWNFVNRDPYLRRNKGSYAEPFAARAPWTHIFDFRITQDLNFRAGNRTHRLQLYFDIFNVGNLLNSEWGLTYRTTPAGAGILTFEGMYTQEDGTVTRRPVFSMRRDGNGNFVRETFERNIDWSQLWRMQIGLRYRF